MRADGNENVSRLDSDVVEREIGFLGEIELIELDVAFSAGASRFFLDSLFPRARIR